MVQVYMMESDKEEGCSFFCNVKLGLTKKMRNDELIALIDTADEV
jgi:hypothetical protein